ncbi:FxsB family radical SAM/SPASM domain protein [Micromonospora sp. WMMD1102]|uniref:FxsB family cyclophane-forming radical SAM/SPASM peptide maturase n=1 Tax=Micromonospora sp. WMMD1102 TaxID=3016105 RepID=UPI002415479E|nr:FxsB family cyclophane-forming radical SAM/SPASM peptide maturase [Micromonospora sp. WMMD1102]MDG4785156.1 FxsB family radical SAM/SPASM domain protein [Micromonospora sp. WMMD1102]
MPIRQFIIKIHSRCNLACDYCYVYTMADQRWRERPRVMSRRIVDATAERLAEHVRGHALPAVDIVLHGGEPLLAGAETMTRCVRAIRAALRDGHADGPASVRFSLQTNGVLLDHGFLELFRDLDVRVGISLDGTRQVHDRHRVDRAGRGSHARVSQALRRLAAPRYRDIYAGLLCTIDLDGDPVAAYRALLDFSPPAVDFLLPDGNWQSPPPGRPADQGDPRYGRWLVAVFDQWYAAPVRQTRVRLFEEIMALWLGGRSRTEGIGGGPSRTVVVETDGSIEDSDRLNATYPGAAATGLDVLSSSFDAVLRLPSVERRRHAAGRLPRACRPCRLRRICGGGYHAHRYRAGTGFDNPSVYCADLCLLITHIGRRLARDVAALRNPAAFQGRPGVPGQGANWATTGESVPSAAPGALGEIRPPDTRTAGTATRATDEGRPR